MDIIIACGPALRQFVAYCRRTRSFLPNGARQAPNEDFAKTRRRIAIRDIFWYRAPELIHGRVLEARSIFDPQVKRDVERTAEKSVPGEWRRKLKRAFTGSKEQRRTSEAREPLNRRPSFPQRLHQKVSHSFFRTTSDGSGPICGDSPPIAGAGGGDGRRLTDQEKGRIGRQYKNWGLGGDEQVTANGGGKVSPQAPFLHDDSVVDTADRDFELADALANPKTPPAMRRRTSAKPERDSSTSDKPQT